MLKKPKKKNVDVETIVDVIMEIKDEEGDVVLEIGTPDGQDSIGVEIEAASSGETAHIRFPTPQGGVEITISEEDLKKILDAVHDLLTEGKGEE